MKHYSKLPAPAPEITNAIISNFYAQSLDLIKSHYLGYALKHMMRLGNKDHWTTEILKSIDYLTYVMTGNFLHSLAPETYEKIKSYGYVAEGETKVKMTEGEIETSITKKV